MLPSWVKTTHRRVAIVAALLGLAVKCVLDIAGFLAYLPGQVIAAPKHVPSVTLRWFWYEFVGHNGTTLDGLLYHWNNP